MRAFIIFIFSGIVLACTAQPEPKRHYYGTLEPFASEAVYFLMTDRFVDGDPQNNFPEQGGDYPTYQLPLVAEDGRKAYVGYMGGDFKGILDHADYIKDMGFTAIWLTPIVNQPDQAFRGGEVVNFGDSLKDGGKTGYHGYWGVNFYQLDEHLPSQDLDFADLTQQLEQRYGIKTILDVVLNHGSPSFSMPEDQPLFGELYDVNGSLIADHMNLEPEALDPSNPLHQMFNRKKDIMQLSDMNDKNPVVMDYFVGAYNQWLSQGAHALRIDTIKHMPLDFWREFSTRMRASRPELFMFAEAYNYEADFIGRYTQPENGGISVLDFPLKKVMLEVFETPEGDMGKLQQALYLENGPYSNPYDLMTFYDNHDMARINTDQAGYINAHNWLFTSRGIPVVYYGSEIGFMSGATEHAGGRNYYGVANIEKAPESVIYQALKTIASVRQEHPALQKGLQVNLKFSKDSAAFLRVYEYQDVNQTALVLLNKSDQIQTIEINGLLSSGEWHEVISGASRAFELSEKERFEVPANGVRVWVYNQKNTNPDLIKRLNQLMDGA